MVEGEAGCGFQTDILIRAIFHDAFAECGDFSVVLLHRFFPAGEISVSIAGKEQRIHQLVQQRIIIGEFRNALSRNCNAGIHIPLGERFLKTRKILLHFLARRGIVDSKQSVHRYVEKACDCRQQGHVGVTHPKLPAGNGLEGDSQNFRKFLLRNVFFSAQAFQSLTELKFHGSVCSFSFEAALLSGLIIAKGKTVGNITVGECFSTIKRTDTKLLVCAVIGAERGGSALPHRLGCGFNPPLMRITKKHPLDAFCDWCGR